MRRGRGSDYDFIVRLTGGRDSTFALYYMTKVAKARVVAYTWDHGMHRSGALANIENAISATGVPHVMHNFFDSHEDCIEHFRVGLESLAAPCRVCFNSTRWGAFLTAFRRGIPFLITGHSEGQIGGEHEVGLRPWKMPPNPWLEGISAQPEQVSRFLEYMSRGNPRIAHVLECRIFEPLIQYLQEVPKDEWPKDIPLANWINWSDAETTDRLLEKEVGYRPASNTIVHTNCELEPLRGYLERKQGVRRIQFELSEFVRSGVITKEKGLEELRKLGMTEEPSPEVLRLIERLGVDRDKFERETSPDRLSGELRHELKRWKLF